MLFRVLLAALVLFAGPALAANKFVRAGAGGSGSGADWTNAYTDLPSSLTRGDTYYVADGSYSGYTFDDDASGTSVITVKKCSTTDGVSSGISGYSSAYCDGQATFGEFNFKRPYYTIDGAYRNASNWKDHAAYGIQVSAVRASRLDGGHSPSTDCSADNMVFQYMHVGTETTAYATWSDSRSFYIGGFGGGSLACETWLISKVLIQNTAEIQCAGGDGITIEDSHFYVVWSKEAIRGQVYCANVIVRRNVFEDACHTAPATTDRCTAEIAAWDGSSMDAWQVYGNVFFRTQNIIVNDIENSNGVILIGDNGWGGAIGPVTNNSVAYNNTIAGIIVAAGTAVVNLNGGSGNIARNNLSYDTTETSTFSANTTSNNVHATSSPFVNYGTWDLRLSGATAAGYTLSSPYNVDRLGVTRGGDGNWDVGAYEYGSGSLLPGPGNPRWKPADAWPLWFAWWGR